MELNVILGIIIGVLVFSKLKGFIFKRFIKTTYNNTVDEDTKKKLAKAYNDSVITLKEYKRKLGSAVREVFPNEKEPIQPNKLRKWYDLTDPVEWIKSFKEIIDLRKIIIYGLIFSMMFGYGWYKGKQGTPVKVDIGYGKEVKIGLNNNEYLHIKKDGTVYLKTKEGMVLKQIAVKDIEGLKRKLSPIGLQFEPIAIMGAGIGLDGVSGEFGAGVSWLRYWKWRLDAFVTNKGFYPLATSYRLTTNSGMGVGIGAGWKGDARTIVYYNWKW